MTHDGETIRHRPLSAWNAFAVLHADAFERLGCVRIDTASFNNLLHAAYAVGIVDRADASTWRVLDLEAWEETLLATDARLRLANV
ncbi:hypothetical protein LCGC14_0772140 [marine sediment metagenome]|uniref:Uncharacterized protein n=1 Tax=marine sediment metagenome TaxID=412755 RepID=A0A0F9SI04_9ZZZZ